MKIGLKTTPTQQSSLSLLNLFAIINTKLRLRLKQQKQQRQRIKLKKRKRKKLNEKSNVIHFLHFKKRTFFEKFFRYSSPVQSFIKI